jgi:Protein of unknown function (DUF1326)
MARWMLSAAAILALITSANAADITGRYVEARTCDVFTGACFANADTSLTGRNGVMAWQVDRGAIDGVNVDGLGIVAVLSAPETLGLRQNGQVKSLVIVDQKATTAQRDALIKMAKEQAGNLLGNIIAIRTAKVDLTICECKDGSCSIVKAGDVRIETRCIDKNHERGCGADCNFYPPLTKGVVARAAMTVEHVFKGKEFNETWSDSERRGAYVGTFTVR